jgi:hypothetical protein
MVNKTNKSNSFATAGLICFYVKNGYFTEGVAIFNFFNSLSRVFVRFLRRRLAVSSDFALAKNGT